MSRIWPHAQSKILSPGAISPAIHEDSISPAVSGRFRLFLTLPHLVALVLYTLLTLFYLAPTVERFFENVPFGGDSWIFYWDLWWVKKALVDLHTNPFYTTFVNYPGGASLNFHTLAFLDGVLTIPLQLLGMSLAGAYNSLVLFGYIFSAYGMFLLAVYLVKDKPAAFIAGLIFGFSPIHFAHLIGQLNFVSLQWMPFYILFMLKSAENDQRGSGFQHWLNPVLAAVFLALNALTEWTLAAFLVIFTGLYWLYRLWQEQRGWRAELRGPSLHLGAVLVIFALLTLPVLLPMLNEARENKNIKNDPQESVIYSADLLSFITPYELHPVMGKWSEELASKFTGNTAERTTYLGFVPLVLAIAGYWLNRKRKGETDLNSSKKSGPGFWWLAWLVFLVMSLGPLLHVGGRSVFTVFKLNIPLPYAVLYYLPFFSIMRTPARFAIVVILALAVLAAFGYRDLNLYLKTRLTGRVKNEKILQWSALALAGLVSLGIAFEFAPYDTTAYPNVPPPYNALRQDPDLTHAVLELPLRQASHFYIAQVAYEKPMIGGYLARYVENPLVAKIPALTTLALRSTTPAGNEAQLREANIRYVLVNWWMLDDDQKLQMEAALQQVFGRPPDTTEAEPDGSRTRISLYIIK